MKTYKIAVVTLVGLLALLLLSISYGAGPYNLADFVAYFLTVNPSDQQPLDTLMQLRLPRTLAAILVGSGLALSATLLQNITQNPLAEPGLLGINSGAVLGMTIGLSYFSAASTTAFMIWAGGGALAAAAVVLLVATLSRRSTPQHLILIGIATSAALGGLANYILMSFAAALEQFRFWNLGSLAGVKMSAVLSAAPYVIGASIITAFLAPSLAVMQLGDDKAKTMGVPIKAVRLGVWIVTSIFTAAAVAIAGPIMFAGFLSAYLARLLVGPHLYQQLFFSAVIGMSLVLFSDISARWIITPYEVPLGVIIALMGTPLTVVALKSRELRTSLVRS